MIPTDLQPQIFRTSDFRFQFSIDRFVCQESLIMENDYFGHCVSCGGAICNEAPWMERYQVCKFNHYVISNPFVPGSSTLVYWTRSGIQLSDVSITNSDWALVEAFGDESNVGHWYFMHQKKPPKAFPVHECCWLLILQQFEGEKIDLDRLFEVCKDIPPSGRPDYDSK